MTNLELCRAHGLIVSKLNGDGRWHRVATTDKPHSTNGAYKVNFNGSLACQNWALDKDAHFYNENAVASDKIANRTINKQLYEDKLLLNKNAAKKAGFILHNSELVEHQYLINKGFDKLKGLVFDSKLVIPMQLHGDVVGCQMISETGDKKFLYGQVCKNATHIIGNHGLNVLVEGYATGLSAHKALMMASIPCKVYVCFSAINMISVGKTLKRGLTIADNDASNTGQSAAEKIGWDYWISPNAGEDLNDYAKNNSYFKISQELKKLIINI